MTTSIYTYLQKRTNNFFKKAKLIHGDKYDYSLVEYIKNSIPVNLICKEHGVFSITPSNLLSGAGCNECGHISKAEKRIAKAAKEFEKKAKVIHGDKFDYSKVEYIKNKVPVYIICPEHGVFPQTPSDHIHSCSGCPKCSSSNGYSKIAIEWLNSISKDIQHAENGGEFKIVKSDGTHFKSDGYDPLTNTIYEFHGDCWHGNLYSPDETPHPFNKYITAKELYQKTIRREEEIKSLGYNLVVIWENDFKNQ